MLNNEASKLYINNDITQIVYEALVIQWIGFIFWGRIRKEESGIVYRKWKKEDYWIDLNLSSNNKYDSIINDDLQLFFKVAITVQTQLKGWDLGTENTIDLENNICGTNMLRWIKSRMKYHHIFQNNCQRSNVFQYDLDAKF